MTWLRHEIPLRDRSYRVSRDQMWAARKWCEHNLSSHGVLWKHEFSADWAAFFFAQPQDLVIFKLMFG